MKTSLFFTALALTAGANLAQAQLLASDDFSYVGALTANGWVAHSGGGNKMIMSDGNVATLEQSSGSGEDVSLAFTPQTAADTTYASFTLNVPSGNPVNPDANGLYFAHVKDAAFGFRARTGLVVPAGGGDFGLAINADSSALGAGATWASDLMFDTNYQVVIAYDAATGTATLWLDPANMASTSISHVGTAATLIEAFAFRQSNDYTGFITVDNVLAGKTFADVMGGAPSGPGTAYCFGDGTSTACPCGNNGAAGEGCANGSGAGAILSGSGSASIGAGDLVLAGSQIPANQPVLFFQGDNAVSGGLGLAFGDGLRCAGGSVVRLEVRTADAGGAASTTINVSTKGGVVMGDTKRYQAWYRDPAGSPCGSAFNLSNGYEITWGM